MLHQMVLVMPDNMTEERRATMRVYGAELVRSAFEACVCVCVCVCV